MSETVEMFLMVYGALALVRDAGMALYMFAQHIRG